MPLNRITASALAGALACALALDTAAAIEPEAAARALGTALASGTDNAAHFERATQQGSDVVIEGLAFGDREGVNSVRFARAVIQAPEEGGDAVFTSPQVTLSDGTVSGDSSGTVENAILTNVRVLSAERLQEQALTQGVVYESAEALGIRVRGREAPADVTIERILINAENIVDDAPQESNGRVEGIVIPPEMFAGTAFDPSSLGYDAITLNMSWDGGLDPDTNVLTVRHLEIAMEDGGRLSFEGRVGNVPVAPTGEGVDASGIATRLDVHDLTLRYVDDSLAGRILDSQAKLQGVPTEQYAQQLSAALPFLLMAINNPEFQNQVVSAIGTFLTNPQSLTIRVAPEAPVSGAEILQTLGSAPQTLPEKLNATISANAPE